MCVNFQKPTIIDDTSSSDEDEETDEESESADSESVETTTSCTESRPNTDEVATPGQPRPREESPHSRKVVCRLLVHMTLEYCLTMLPLYL